MKIINIFALLFIPIFLVSCSSKTENRVNNKNLAMLEEQTEHDNSFVINAKNRLLSFVGKENFDQYVTQNGILQCQNSEKQSECVLNFYLTEVAKLDSDSQVKKAIAETQAQSDRLAYFTDKVKNYCNLSADFIDKLYTKSEPKLIPYYQQRFKLTDKALASLTSKISNDKYSQFLISENPTVVEEMKTDFMEKCLVDPKANIINYTAFFN